LNASRAAGVSLLEMAVCLAILAILATYAMPSYQAERMRAYRADAVAALYRAAHDIETRAADGEWQEGSATLSPDLAQAPPGANAVYTLSLAPATADNGGYTLEATPVPDGVMQGDVPLCGDFVLDATGHRANRIDGAVRDDRVAVCWDGAASPTLK